MLLSTRPPRGWSSLNRFDVTVLLVGYAMMVGGIAWLSLPWALIIGGATAIVAVLWDDGKP